MDRGGAEMRTLDLMHALRKRKSDSPIQFDFCSLSGQRGDLDPVIEDLGGKVHLLPLNLRFPKNFTTLLKTQKYHSVHSHVHLFSGFLLKLAASVKIESRICNLHTTGTSDALPLRKKLQYRLMSHWLRTHATALVAVSNGVREAFLAQDSRFKSDSRLEVIYDAIDPTTIMAFQEAGMPNLLVRRELGLSASDVFVIHVGRLNEVKNHTRLLEIFAAVLKSVPAAKLLMIGKTEAVLLEALHRKARSLAIEDKIQFLGMRDDAIRLIANADLMIFPSLWEGLPGVVLEAASFGVPVLGSDLPGTLELKNHFTSIEALSLAESNQHWAQSAAHLLENRTDLRATALAELNTSPFTVASCLASLEPLWRNAR